MRRFLRALLATRLFQTVKLLAGFCFVVWEKGVSSKTSSFLTVSTFLPWGGKRKSRTYLGSGKMRAINLVYIWTNRQFRARTPWVAEIVGMSWINSYAKKKKKAANGVLPMNYEDTTHVAPTQSSSCFILRYRVTMLMGVQVPNNQAGRPSF